MKRKNFLIATMLGVGLLSSLSSAAQQVVTMTTDKAVGSAMTLVVNRSVQDLTVDWGDGNPVAFPNGMGDFQELQGEKKGDLIKISAKDKLQTLICADQELKTLDVSGAKSLVTLSCQNNNLTTLDLTGMVELVDLNCANNKFTEFSLPKELIKLENLNIANNKLNNMGQTSEGIFVLSRCSNLQVLDISNNEFEKLFVTTNGNLKSLNFINNKISSIDLSPAVEASVLLASDNALETMKVNATNGLPEMKHLFVDNNKLASLDLSKSVALKTLSATSNLLSNLVLPEVKMDVLYLGGNKLHFMCFPKSANIPTTYVVAPQTLDISDRLIKDHGKYYARTNSALDLADLRKDADENNLTINWFSVDAAGNETALVRYNSSTKEGDFKALSGKFTFLKNFDEIYCKMSSDAYPGMEIESMRFGVSDSETLSIGDVFADNTSGVKVSVSNGALCLQSASPVAAKVFSVGGKLVWGGLVDGNVELNLPTGVYIVDGNKVVL